MLISVAAACGALVVLRAHLREADRAWKDFGLQGSVAGHLFWTSVIRSVPVLVASSLALLLMRLRRPRPSRRRLFRQPGTVACLAVAFSGTLSVLANVAILRAANPRVANPVTYCLSGLERLGGAIMLVWLTLALGGSWRPAPDWIDRSGRVLGVALIVVYVLSISHFLRP